MWRMSSIVGGQHVCLGPCHWRWFAFPAFVQSRHFSVTCLHVQFVHTNFWQRNIFSVEGFSYFRNMLSKIINCAFEISALAVILLCQFACAHLYFSLTGWCQNKFCELLSCIAQCTNKLTCSLWINLVTLYNKQRNGTKGGNGGRAIAPTRHG